jgi:hypothetical protein
MTYVITLAHTEFFNQFLKNLKAQKNDMTAHFFSAFVYTSSTKNII